MSRKLSIKNDQGESIVGILEIKNDYDPRLMLIAHGALGHKDYLFQRILAQEMPYNSFRIDFRGNGESTGNPGYANFWEDAEDLHTVADHFTNQGFEIYAVIGHSRGSVAAFNFAASLEKPIPFVVNISGRYDFNHEQIASKRPDIVNGLKKQGFFDWSVKQRDRVITIKVTQKQIDRFMTYNSDHVSKLSMATSVLTCHGVDDVVVPPTNAAMFANAVPNHTLLLFDGADHNFKGKYRELVQAVIEFFARHDQGGYSKALGMRLNAGIVIPRWVDVEGVRNLRDIGGWPLKDGSGYVRERTVFRSAHLTDITPLGCEKLSDLNIKDVFDFRTGFEKTKKGTLKPIEGVQRHEYDLYSEAVKTPQDYLEHLLEFLNGPEGFAKGYMAILESGKKLLGDAFRYMIDNLSTEKQRALLVHCTAGKDRTGLFVMLLLGLCGVDDEIIASEYDLSKIGYFEYENRLGEIAKQVGVSEEKMRAALSTSYEGMQMTIALLKEKYGSYEGYIREACGLSEQEIKAIRNLLIVPIRFEEKQLYRARL